MATVFLSLTEFMFKVALQVLKHAYTKVCSVLLKKQSYIQLCYKVEKHFLGYSEGTSLQYCKHAHCHPSKHIQFLSKQGMYNKNNKKDTISQLVIHKNQRSWKGPPRNHQVQTPAKAFCRSRHPDFECLQRRRLHNLWTAHSNALSLSSLGEVLPHICMELPVLQLLPVAPYPVTEHLQRAQPHPLDFHTLDAYKQ